MTVFVWDASSYDGLISLDAAKRAADEGIVAVVHRLTRQGGQLDPNAGRNLNTFRQAGFGLIGAYAVTYTSGGHSQDALTIQQADQVCPWWKDFPGWWWMEDLERWPTDAVPAGLGIAIATELEQGSGKRCSLYASHSQYGDQLRAWTGPLVNADYTGRPAGGFRAMYPGDTWRPDHGSWNGGWTAYSGREPDLLQYTSSATVGGLTTCDVSAYRGTVDQLYALLTGGASTPGGTVTTIPAPDNASRSDVQILGDLGNMRNLFYGPLAGYKPGYAPDANTVLDALVRFLRDPAAALGTAPVIDLDALAGKIADRLIASGALAGQTLTLSLTGTAEPAPTASDA